MELDPRDCDTPTNDFGDLGTFPDERGDPYEEGSVDAEESC